MGVIVRNGIKYGGGDSSQVTELPTATEDLLGTVYQYIGATTANYTHNYFYECVVNNGVYSWQQTNVQSGGGSSIQVDELPTASLELVGKVYQYVGTTTANYTHNYFYECVNNGGVYSWQVTDVQSHKTIQYNTLPTATAELVGKVYQYTGATNSTYTHNYFYECVNDNGTYLWKPTEVQASIQCSVMPTASAELLGKVRQYIGATTEDYIHNYFYECVEKVVDEDVTYEWVQTNVNESTQFEVLPEPSEKWLNRIVQFTGNAPYTNGYFYKCVYNQGQYEWIEWYVMRTMTTPALVDVSGASIERVHRVATIRWTDPEDSEISGQVQAEWGGTKLLRKIGSAPQNEEDGELITNSVVRNQYSEDGFVDDTLEYDKVYYYRFFPYSTINVVTKGTAIMVNCKRDIVPLPTQTVPLYYNGKNQTPTLSSSVGIVKSGETSGKDVGQYTMTLSLESNDYVWADNTYTDKTLTWTIGKAQPVITPSKTNIELGAHQSIYNVSFSDLYDRTITSVVSSDTDICTVSTDGEVVTLQYAGIGEATITVTTDATANSESATITLKAKGKKQVIYGFQIDGNESNPSSMVTYLSDCDNANYTPAYMNFSTGTFDYGSWQENEFFMPKPCMVNYDGTVAYYLDPSDYTKKADGVTPSDVSDTTFQGNAMMEWGRDGDKIWYKIVPYNSGISAKIYIANYQVDSGYQDWSFHNCDGVSADHFYTPIYNGSLVDSKLRSMSGQNILNKRSGTDEMTYAKANNQTSKELWNIECLADRQLINFLLILIGKSTNSQAVFGQGACNGGSESVNNTFTTGVHNTKGIFYGTNSGSVSSYNFDNCVKVFGMENYYGLIWRRTNGLMYISNNQKVKLTYGQEDGSGVTGYNTDGANYIDLGVSINGTSGGYINQMKFNDKGMFIEQVSGSDSTYYTDGCWFTNGTQFSLFGGDSDNGGGVGAFYVTLDIPVSRAYWGDGAALSLKPLT